MIATIDATFHYFLMIMGIFSVSKVERKEDA